MKKILHIARANILRHKGAAISLFAIIMIVSALTTTGLSILLEVENDYYAGVDRLHSLHNFIVMPRDKFEPGFEDIFKNDTNVAEYEIQEALMVDAKINYGGEIDWNVIIANIETPLRISAPKITELDLSIPSTNAIYLPLTAKNVGYKIGDVFTIVYVNKPLDFIIAGFFQTNELAVTNTIALKFFVSGECYEKLLRQLPRCTVILARFIDPKNASTFNNDFSDKTSLDFGIIGMNLAMSSEEFAFINMFPVIIVSVIILLFSFIIAFISLIVIRFRITNNIDDTMHEIGVLKAAGYTSSQITLCYIAEYGMMAIPAALFGIILPIPVFGFLRRIVSTITGFGWTFGVNYAACFLAAMAIVAAILMMAWLSARRIKKLPPVEALRGGIASNNFRSNFFPLDKKPGNVHLRLAFKNMFAYFKHYAMIGVIIAFVTIAVTVIYAMYFNFVIDQSQLIRMAGFELCDLSLTVTKHTDANALAAELEKMPEVRKTSMEELLSFKVEDYFVLGTMSNDFSRMEFKNTHDGRFPIYDNEIAIPKGFANILGKGIGDSVAVKAKGVSLDYLITGHFSTLSNGGLVASMTLEGYQRLDPNANRSNIRIYLNEGVDYELFIKKLEHTYGVLNVYRQEESSMYAASKAHAEEKISTYLERYAIDSIEYAVLYNDEIILSGSSEFYQIKNLINEREFVKSQLGVYSITVSAIMQLIAFVSLIILSLILYMTVRSIVSKRRRELGILKSCGYTTRQLANQLSLSFMPIVFTGVIAGCAIGAVSASPLLVVTIASTGIYNASFPISRLSLVVISSLTMLVTYAVSYISAMRIKNISVYELLTE